MASQKDKDRNSRVKVSRRLNVADRDNIRHTFLSAGGSVPLPPSSDTNETETEDEVSVIHNHCFYNHSENLVENLRSELALPANAEKINSRDSIGLSALHLLCGFNASSRVVEALEVLVEYGANVRAVDLRGYTPLHYVCFNLVIETDLQLKVLAALVRHGADVNAKEFLVRASPLHLLCYYTNFKKLDDLLTFFIRHKASLHARTFENRTPLHGLCRMSRGEHLLSAVTLLMRHGADANVRDDKNLTALHEVCLFYNRPDLDQVIDQLLSVKATCINYGAMHKRTAFHLLAIHYHHENLPDLIRSMIEKHGADPNQGDEKFRTPFHYVLQYNRSPRWSEAVEVLLRNGADAGMKDVKQGQTALLHACLNFYQVDQLPRVIGLLIKSDPGPINVLDKSHRSVLHYLTSALAVDLNVSQCIELLLPRLTPQTVDAVSTEGTTALTQAARLGCVSALKQLIPLATKNVTDAFGKNVLDYLKELGERKMRPVCACCRSRPTLELAAALVKQLNKKERIRLQQPDEFSLEKLDGYLLDKSPYLRFLDEDRLVKPPSAKWLEFFNYWKATLLFQQSDAQRLKNFMRDLTHQCKLPPLLPARRNKCNWCDTIGTVYNYVKTLTDKVGQLDPRFRASSVITYGSLAEGTRLIAPDAYHFAIVMQNWREDPSGPMNVQYLGPEPVDNFYRQPGSSPNMSPLKVTKHYHCLLETASRWVQRFEILEHWTSVYDESSTTIYLVCRAKNNQPPLRLTVNLCLSIQRTPVELRKDYEPPSYPSWCQVAEIGEEEEYLSAKAVSNDWRPFYPALERDSIRHAGWTVLQVFQLVKLLAAASNCNENGETIKRDPSTFSMKTCLLLYMELNPPPWNSVDVILHSLGVIDVFLDKHGQGTSFFESKNKGASSQMSLFSPMSFDTKKIVAFMKLQLSGLLNERHHSFTI